MFMNIKSVKRENYSPSNSLKAIYLFVGHVPSTQTRVSPCVRNVESRLFQACLTHHFSIKILLAKFSERHYDYFLG